MSRMIIAVINEATGGGGSEGGGGAKAAVSYLVSIITTLSMPRLRQFIFKTFHCITKVTCDSQPGGIRILPSERRDFRKYVTRREKPAIKEFCRCRSADHYCMLQFNNTIKFYICK